MGLTPAIEHAEDLGPIEHVVVPLDRSALSETALAPARWLATQLDADVRLVTSSFDPNTDAEAAYLRTCGESVGIDDAAIDVVADQFPVQAIVHTMAGRPRAALCMATRGQGVAPHTLGGVADEVVHESTEPVVLVGPSYDASSFPRGPALVVPLDGSVRSASILGPAERWARALGFAVHLVSVRTTYGEGCSHTMLEAMVSNLDRAGIRTFAVHRSGEDIAGEVLTVANDANATLIALAPTGHGGAMNRALGYVATDIVQRAPIPVLVQRATREAAWHESS